jgi:hypothetical protein
VRESEEESEDESEDESEKGRGDLCEWRWRVVCRGWVEGKKGRNRVGENEFPA